MDYKKNKHRVSGEKNTELQGVEMDKSRFLCDKKEE